MANRIARLIASNPKSTLTSYQIIQGLCSPQEFGDPGFDYDAYDEELRRQIRKVRIEMFGDYLNLTPFSGRKWKRSMDRLGKREERRQATEAKYGDQPFAGQLLDEYDEYCFDDYDAYNAWLGEDFAEDIALYNEYQEFLLNRWHDAGLIERYASSFDVYLDNRWRFDYEYEQHGRERGYEHDAHDFFGGSTPDEYYPRQHRFN